MSPEGRVTRWLRRAPTGVFIAYAIAAAFGAYFCMYAFRKPFAVGTFAGRTALPLVGSIDTKALLIVAQILGYCLSKFLGIKVISELRPARRALAIAGAIGVAELALLLFGVAAPPWSALCLFMNGLPLGLVWGLVFGFLEGRRVSDALGAGLCASFIVASGFVKTVGKLLLDRGVAEQWMPAATGALFLVPMALCVSMLARLPPPSPEDERERFERVPMDRRARWRFFAAIAPGMVLLTLSYMLLTAYRDFRDNFARELWDALGHGGQPEVLTTAEVPVAAGALLAVALCMAIRDSKVALLVIHAAMLGGVLLVGGATVAFENGAIGPVAWMVLVGLGLYLGYVPFNCVLFDRLIPAVGHVGTAGFFIYVADAFGYLGSVGVVLTKSLGAPNLSWLRFFRGFSHATAWLGALLLVGSALYFARRRPEALRFSTPG